MTDTDIAAELEKPWTSVAHWQALGGQAAAAISALQAEKEALREQVVTVKPLEWEDTSRSFSGERLSAQTIFGVEYVCLWDDRSISWSVFIWGEWKGCGDAGGLEKAKAAAQADYERRILSAIDTVSVAQARKEALEEAGAIAYRVCAETRHGTLGLKVEDAIYALIEKEGGRLADPAYRDRGAEVEMYAIDMTRPGDNHKTYEKTMNKVQKAVAQFRQMQRVLDGGCSDGYCVIERTKGMHTNGGCNCLYKPDFITLQRVGHMLRSAQIMADALEDTTNDQ